MFRSIRRTRHAVHANTRAMYNVSSCLSVLQVGLVWPEEHGSAAGVRTVGITKSLASLGCDVTVAASSGLSRAAAGSAVLDWPTATPEQPTRMPGRVRKAAIRCNDSAGTHALLNVVNPDLVVFDRFMSEEMFSHHVRAWSSLETDAPASSSGCTTEKPVMVLDMQDFHALRRTRQEKAKDRPGDVNASFHARPDASSVLLQREMASMLRMDAVWAVSETEQAAVETVLGRPMGTDAALGPVMSTVGFPSISRAENVSKPRARRDVVMIGTFRHDPNVDAIGWAIDEVWPSVLQSSSLAGAESGGGVRSPVLHIYGSHLSDSQTQSINKSIISRGMGERIVLHGRMTNLDELQQYRVMLVPLRFGAGVKGKVLDAWHHGLPVVTTPIGSEGLVSRAGTSAACDWGGDPFATTAAELAESTVALLQDDAFWRRASSQGRVCLEQYADPERLVAGMRPALELAASPTSLALRRRGNLMQAMVWHSALRSTQFMSRYIEAKNACPERV